MDKEIERIIEIFGAVKNSDAGKVYEAQVSDTRIVAAVCGIGVGVGSTLLVQKATKKKEKSEN